MEQTEWGQLSVNSFQRFVHINIHISNTLSGAMALSGVKAAEEALKVFEERKRENAA